MWNSNTFGYKFYSINQITVIECLIAKFLNKNTDYNKIEWQEGYWAVNCNFPGNDLFQLRLSKEDCFSSCVNTPNCTHFAWSPGT